MNGTGQKNRDGMSGTKWERERERDELDNDDDQPLVMVMMITTKDKEDSAAAHIENITTQGNGHWT